MVNKRLEKLAIAISCLGLINNSVGCGLDAGESRECTVELSNAIAGPSSSDGNSNIYENVNISLTQQQVDEINSGKCPEGFIESLNKASFSNLKEYELYNFTAASFQGGLKIKDGKIIVSTVKDMLRFRMDRENKRIYIYDHRFKHQIYAIPFLTNIEWESKNCRNVEDLNGALEDFQASYIGNVGLYFPRTSIISHDDLIKFCDAVCFLEELSERRSEGIKDTIRFLRDLDFNPNRYCLTKHSANEYILTAQHMHHELRTTAARYEFFLENESEKNDWHKEEYDSFYKLKFFEQSKMILKKVKFLDWEYSFKKELYLIDWINFTNVERLLNEGKNNKLRRFHDFTLSDFEAAWKSFNLKEVFAPIEKELSFIESLAEARGEDMWDMMEFLTKISVGPSINKFLLTQDPETKNYSMKCILERYSILLYELGIESTFSLPTELLSSEEFNRMIDDMKSDGANIFVRSIKLVDKEYTFQHDIDLIQKGRNMFDQISEHLGTHMKEKLDYILFHETKERWNSIDLAEAMRPIEEMND